MMGQNNDTGWKNNTPHPCMQQRVPLPSARPTSKTPNILLLSKILAGIIGIGGLVYMKLVHDNLATLPSILCVIMIVIGFYGIKNRVLFLFNK